MEKRENATQGDTQPYTFYVCVHVRKHIYVHLCVCISIRVDCVCPAESVGAYLITDKRRRLRVEGVSRMASYFSSAAAGRISIFVPITT